MEINKHPIQERVRNNTSETINREIDQQTTSNLRQSHQMTNEQITQRLEVLRKEWDIERLLEVNAASISLASLLLAATSSKRWLMLTGIVGGFLLQHAVQGWCPPLPLFRSMGYRTRQEIDEEIYAMKVLRGDFDAITSFSGSREILSTVRK